MLLVDRVLRIGELKGESVVGGLEIVMGSQCGSDPKGKCRR